MFKFDFKDKSQEEIDRFVVEVLDKIKAKSGTRRKNMFRKGHNRPEPKGSFSICYGYCNLGYLSPTKQRKKVEGTKNLYETTFLTEHPELKGILQQLCDLHCPEPIQVDQVHINKNWLSPPHKDAGNQNESWIVGLGDYKKGELVIEFDEFDVDYNIKNTFTKFDGSQWTHYTKDFEGTRYSIVFYQHSVNKI